MLDPTIKLSTLIITFTNRKLIPEGIKEKVRDGGVPYNPARVNGVQFIEPTSGVSGLGLIDDFAEAGHTLVDAWWEEKYKDERPYYQVRFTYAAPGHDQSSEEFRETIPVVIEGLQELFFHSTWRVRVFANPFFRDSEIVEGTSALSLNFEAREPLFGSDGKPLLRWQRDDAGKKIGEAPVALQPTKFLRIVEDDICVVEGVGDEVVAE